MRNTVRKLARLFKSMLRAERGVAVVEFALVVPIMLATYVGCTEAATLLTVDRKVQSVAGAMGDLVARTNKTMTKDQMKDYFRAATSIMTPYTANGLTQTVTAVSVSAQGVTKILWSVRYSGDTYYSTVAEYQVGKPYALPAEMIAIAKGQTVIAAEAEFDYTPPIGIFGTSIDLHRSGLFMPRYGGNITIT